MFLLLAVLLGGPAPRLAVLGAAAMSGQLVVGWTNDVVDRERDRSQQRRDKPLARGEIEPRPVVIAAVVAAVICVVTSLSLGWVPALAHFVAVGSALGYNAGLKNNAWSWLPYAVSFGMLPVVVWTAMPPFAWPPWWALVAAVLLAMAGHGIDVLPDRTIDLATDVRPLPHLLPVSAAWALILLFLVIGTAVLVTGAWSSGGLDFR